MNVAALYVDADHGPYAAIENVDVWAWPRDARLYDGPWPIVAHPPCAGWGRLRDRRRYFWRKHNWDSCRLDVEAREFQCAPIAVWQVRQWGGVLEHPAYSKLWSFCNLPLPSYPADDFGGVTYEIYQGNFGYPAPKKTWLYIVGANVDEYVLMMKMPCHSDGRVSNLSSTIRHLTPPLLARELVDIARGCHGNSDPLQQHDVSRCEPSGNSG